jgi:hypothetical protein
VSTNPAATAQTHYQDKITVKNESLLDQVRHQGIPNYFNTQCYISAALQMIKSMKCFKQFVENLQDIPTDPFLHIIIEFFKELDSNDGSADKIKQIKSSYIELLQILRDRNPNNEFAERKQGDSAEVFNCLMNNFEEDIQSISNIQKTLFKDNFQSLLEYCSICASCDKRTPTTQPLFLHVLHVNEENASSKDMYELINDSMVTKEIDTYNCSTCCTTNANKKHIMEKRAVKATRTTKYIGSPKMIEYQIPILKMNEYGGQNKLFSIKTTLHPILNIDNKGYKLRSVICHLGEDPKKKTENVKGHYVCYWRLGKS